MPAFGTIAAALIVLSASNTRLQRASAMSTRSSALGGAKKPSKTAVDVVTCKMKGNKDKKDDVSETLHLV